MFYNNLLAKVTIVLSFLAMTFCVSSSKLKQAGESKITDLNHKTFIYKKPLLLTGDDENSFEIAEYISKNHLEDSKEVEKETKKEVSKEIKKNKEKLNNKAYQKSKQNKKKASSFNLRLEGDELIREKLRKNGRRVLRVTLKGRAKLYYKKIRVLARRIVIEDKNKASIIGNVRIYDPQSGIRVYSQKAVYYAKTKSVVLDQNPYLEKYILKKGKKQRLLVNAKKIEYFLAESRLLFSGSMQLRHVDWKILAEKGEYILRKKKLVLNSDPVYLLARDAKMTGMSLVFDERQGIAKMEGESMLHLNQKISLGGRRQDPTIGSNLMNTKNTIDSTLEKDTEFKGTSFLSADQISYFKDGHIKAKGQVVFTQPNLRFEAEDLRLYDRDFSDDFRDIDAKGNVHVIDITDIKNKVEFSAQNMQYRGESRYLVLTEMAQIALNNPSTQLPIDKTSKSFQSSGKDKQANSIILSAEYIDRDYHKKLIQAQGKVIFSQNDYEGFSEIARCPIGFKQNYL